MAESRVPLTFGILPVIDTLPFLVGAEKGFFADVGIDLKILSFSSALERDTALQSNRIDGYFGDLLNTLLLINSGRSLSIVSTVFHTRPDRRMFALLASPKSGITGIRQAGAKQIAISRASVAEYVLDRMLAEKGMDSQSVKKTEIRAIPIRYQMLITDKIKLAVLPEPLVTQAESQGARVIADDRTLDMSLTVFAFNKAFLATHPGVADRFLRAYKRAVEAVNRQPDVFKGLLLEKTQLPPSIKDLFKVPTFPVSMRPTGRDVEEVEDWLLKNRLIAKPIPFGSVVMR
jgi:NitT/TauT family transport system substrate-binding protein